jgi:hypothetical protein
LTFGIALVVAITYPAAKHKKKLIALRALFLMLDVSLLHFILSAKLQKHNLSKTQSIFGMLTYE